MAGAVRATFGSLTLVLGILLLLAGLGAAAYGYLDEQEHREEAGPLGVARDEDRSDLNQALQVGGGVGAALGLVLLVVGIAVVSTGRTTDAARRGPGGSDIPHDPDVPARGPARVGVVAAVVGGLVVVLVAATLLASGDVDGSGRGLFSGDPEPRMLGEERVEGTVGATFTVLGGSQMPAGSANSDAVPVPAGAVRTEVEVTWSPADNGAERLQVTLQANTADGWIDLETLTGPSVLWINATLDGAQELRLRVFPGEDGAVAQQDYAATVRFWDA